MRNGVLLLKKALILVVGLALLLALGVLVSACGQSNTQTNTPKQVATQMMDDLKAGNWTAAYNLLSSADKKLVTLKQWTDTYTKQGTPPKDLTYSVTKTKLDGNKAVVTLKISQGGQSQEVPLALVKEGNTWKISTSTSSTLNEQ
jgi:hypothetical protein